MLLTWTTSPESWTTSNGIPDRIQRNAPQYFGKTRNEMMLMNIYSTLFLTHVVHLGTVSTNQRCFAPTLAHITGITGPLHRNTHDRYRRRESSVEEALIEMYLAGVSVRRVEDITQALWGTRVSASTVSELNQKTYGKID
jgi:Transposase, Mutator family